MQTRTTLLIGVLSALTFDARGELYSLRGRVVMEDGSAPGKSVFIDRVCPGNISYRESVTNKNGEYIWRVEGDRFGVAAVSTGSVTQHECILLAKLTGYESTTIDLMNPRLLLNPVLPTLVLYPAGSRPPEALETTAVASAPKAAARPWAQASKAMESRKWAEVERFAQAAVDAAPKFAAGWHGLGLARQNLGRREQARAAYRRAVEIDPKLLRTHAALARIELDDKNWAAAAASAETVIKADHKKRHVEVYFDAAVAYYQLREWDKAEAALKPIQNLEKRYPRLEYMLGVIQHAKGDRAAAGDHYRRYLELHPKASDASQVRDLLADLSKPADPAKTTPVLTPADLSDIAPSPEDMHFPSEGEAAVPGGIKALAAIALMKDTPAPGDFYRAYCTAIAEQEDVFNRNRIPRYRESLLAYISTIAELERMGAQAGDARVVTIDLAADRLSGERILALLGWRVVREEARFSVEPSDTPDDALRRGIPQALGIDEVGMQQVLNSGQTASFQIAIENARLTGGAAWTSFLTAAGAGSIAEAFARDSRLARACSGLSSMEPDAAAAVVKGAGLSKLVTVHSQSLWRYGNSFSLEGGLAATPGGPEAAEVWAALTGKNPRDPPAFFRALLEKDTGRMTPFFWALRQAGAARQQFFTKTTRRAERIYAWYRDSDELRPGPEKMEDRWRTALLRDLPLDDQGNLRFPGSPDLWNSSTGGDPGEQLAAIGSLETMLDISRIEEKSKTRFDREPARLLKIRGDEWRALFPYFRQLPALGREEFQALAGFSDAAAALSPADRNSLLGQWHGLVTLAILGIKSGALDSNAAAHVFRRACERLRPPDHSARALEILREMTGNAPSLDEAVAGRILGLDGARREAFDRIRRIQQAPTLDSVLRSNDPSEVTAAFTGAIYGAFLDPEGLLVSEDRGLLRRHRFTGAALFPPSKLEAANRAPGSHFSGGFMEFETLAAQLASAGSVSEPAAVADSAPLHAEPRAPGAMAEAARGAVFRANARLVEVYATVQDVRGRYLDDLNREDFNLLDEGRPAPLVAFENKSTGISCALLLDTTGSMQPALPALKAAALKLIDSLRPADSVAVFAFSDKVSELQPFTTDRRAAKRAVLLTKPEGTTALYDALVRVNRAIAGRPGKKAIVVFTDGEDNSSTLAAGLAILRAKTTGVPIYTIAQGPRQARMQAELADVSRTTGGIPYAITQASEIRGVFDKVVEDLTHGYLLVFQPAPAGDDRAWRKIEVKLANPRNRKVRAREGYNPD